MSSFQSFICYSHKDAHWKDCLCDHLAAVGLTSASAWHDGNLNAGDDFQERIFAAIDAASMAIILVSEHSLSSEFIMQKEVPRLLARRQEDGLRIIPVVVRPCAWRSVGWLASLELRPKGGTPLSSFSDSDSHLRLAELVEEIHRLASGVVARTVAGQIPLPPQSVSTSRLPPSGRIFVGRDDDVSALDNAWKNPATTMVTVNAWAGVGKSALVNHWLGKMRRDRYRGAERVFAWTFDGQGGARASSAEPFLHAALSWFGESTAAESSWVQGERLAQAVQRSRSLLILDGLEPLQLPPGPNEGSLREEGMRALLCGLAESNPGLCVVTSREPIFELAPYEPNPVQRLDLHTLSTQTGMSLLRSMGVQGDDSDLAAAVLEYDGHCLALTLLASFLADVCRGDVRRRHEIGPLTGDLRLGAQARRILSSYESWFGEGPEIALLSWLSLMERPTDEQLLADICRGGSGHGPAQVRVAASLSDPLKRLSPIEWRQLLGRLQRAHLVRVMEDGASTAGPAALTQNQTLYLHPLVREYFRERLRAQPRKWQEANEWLFNFLAEHSPLKPETLAELTSLYDAVRHGCWAGRRQEALEKVYWPRIRRGGQAYSTRKLGAFEADVVALSHFFDRPFARLTDDIPPRWRAPVLGWTGFRLYVLGRLDEAAHVLWAGFETLISEGNVELSAKLANHLFLVLLARGELRECQALVERMLNLAKEGDEFNLRLWQVNRGLWLWNAGRRKEADREFRKAAPDDEIPEGHALTTLCRILPQRQIFQLVSLLTEAGDPRLALDYTQEQDYGSDLTLDALCSGIPLNSGSDPGLSLDDQEIDNTLELSLDEEDSARPHCPAEDSDVRLAGENRDGGPDAKLDAPHGNDGSALDRIELGSDILYREDAAAEHIAEDSGLILSLDLDGVEEDTSASEPGESFDDVDIDIEWHVYETLRTLLRAHAEVVQRESEPPTPTAAEPGVAGDADEDVTLLLDIAATDSLDRIVSDLRRAGLAEFVAFALLIRARHRRLHSQIVEALGDLEEALALTARCGLKLLSIDLLIAKATLLADTGQSPASRQTLATAAQAAKRVGYYRQAATIRTLAGRLRGAS